MKKAALESAVSISGKTANWLLVFSLADLVMKGKCLDGNLWQWLIPLAIVAGIIWFWAIGQLPNEK